MSGRALVRTGVRARVAPSGPCRGGGRGARGGRAACTRVPAAAAARLAAARLLCSYGMAAPLWACVMFLRGKALSGERDGAAPQAGEIRG